MARVDRLANVEPAPTWLRQFVSVIMTASAALLYAIVLGVAIVRTFQEGDPVFSITMSRAAGVLGGLVGAVVATGFSRSGRGVSVQAAGPRRDLIQAPIHWVKRNFFGLAETLGLPLLPEIVLWTDPDDALDPGEPAPDTPWYELDEPAINKISLGISILYFLIYFAAGFGAFGLSVARANVPELISNAAWVWLGSLVSSGYSFFALNSDSQIIS
jgi:hypothetical protein